MAAEKEMATLESSVTALPRLDPEAHMQSSDHLSSTPFHLAVEFLFTFKAAPTKEKKEEKFS
jgi:hypothetical protein